MISFALISSIATGAIAFFSASSEMKTVAQDRLYSLMDSRKSALENYFLTIERDLKFHANSPLVVSSLEKFTAAFNDIDGSPTTYLHNHYIETNPFSYGNKDALLAASDDSSYSQLHKYYHPVFRRLMNMRSFHDLFLISAAGDLVYSVSKEADFASNMLTGKWKDSHLAHVFRTISKARSPGLQVFTDFDRYVPSNNGPASFIGSPVFNSRGNYMGALVFQMPIAPLNNVMQVTAGMGETGETYLVGSDFLMRSDSRFFEGRSILEKSVDTLSVRRALAGEAGVDVIEDYRGITVFSAFVPVDFLNVRWALIAEIDKSEIMQPVYNMSRVLLLIGAVIACIIFAAGLILAFDIASPVLVMAKTMTRLAKNKLDTNISVSSRNDEVGEMAKALIVFKENALEREKLQEKLTYLANYDLLTGLPARQYLLDSLTKTLLLAEKEKTKFIFMFIDLDNFKRVNDTLGHSVGDQLLKSVGERLCACVCENDIVSRFGGDEFVIILSNVSDISDGHRVAAKINQAIDKNFLGLGDIKIGASIGVALFPDHGENAATLLSEADKAMYIAKKSGGNRFFSADIDSNFQDF